MRRGLALLLVGGLALGACGDVGSGGEASSGSAPMGLLGPQAPPDQVIRTDTEGNLLAVGDWKGPSIGPPLDIASLTEAFGRTDPTGSAEAPGESLVSCGLYWEELGLWAYADNFGGIPPGASRCDPEWGLIQAMTMTGPGSKRWRTEAGVRVGDDLATVERLHPGAEPLEYDDFFTHALVSVSSPPGPDELAPTVVARIEGGEVTALGAHPRGAGE